MHRIIVTLSDTEYQALRRRAFDDALTMAELVRSAIDQLLDTDHREIRGRGRPPESERISPSCDAV